jgi:hypothetical protein
MIGLSRADVTGAEDLGPGDLAQIYSPFGAKCRNPEAIRMAYVRAHVLDSAAKCRDRIQGDARTAPTFDLALNVGRLHSGDYSGVACSASSRRIAGPFPPVRTEDHSLPDMNVLPRSHTEKGHKKRAKRALIAPSMVSADSA